MSVNGRLRTPGSRVDIRRGVLAGYVPIMRAKTVDRTVIYCRTIGPLRIVDITSTQKSKHVYKSTQG